MPPKPHRRTNGRRRPPSPERKSILVVCEGATEEEYFKGFRERGANIRLEVQTPRWTHASGLVEHARRRIMDGFHQAWAVFDTENGDVSSVRREASDCGDGNQIKTVVSHPSFEVWLLLHHIEPTQVHHCWDAAASARKLKEILPEWRKGKWNPQSNRGTRFDDFAAGVQDACVRAQALEKIPGAPFTDVYRFVHAKERGFPDKDH